jgi:hypothetical protein
MRKLDLVRRELDPQKFNRKPVSESDCKNVVDEPTIIRENGRVVAVLDYVEEPMDEFIWALKSIKRFDRGTRGSGLVTQSKVFGFTPRRPTRNHHDYCTSASLAHEQPEVHNVFVKWASIAQNYYAEHAYARLCEHQKYYKSKVQPIWSLNKTVFTSGIINKSNALGYHLDRGNFSGQCSAMIVAKNQVSGGRLVLPEFDMKLELRNGAILIFDGQSIWHGVTPMRRLHAESMRYSVVYYSLEQMWQCLSPKDEVARAQRIRTEREARRADK